MTLNHIGNVLMEQGQYAWAQEYCERSLDARRRVLGPRHPKVAASLNNLAEIARKLGDAAAALQLVQESLEIVGGSSWPEEEIALKIAGWANERLANTDAAIASYQRLVEVLERGESPTGPAMVLAWQRLAELHETKGDRTEAVALLERVLAVDRRADPADAARNLLRLSALHSGLDDADAARDAWERAAALMRADRLQNPELEALLERQRQLLGIRDRDPR